MRIEEYTRDTTTIWCENHIDVNCKHTTTTKVTELYRRAFRYNTQRKKKKRKNATKTTFLETTTNWKRLRETISCLLELVHTQHSIKITRSNPLCK